ncbi:MAG: AgmX/PglI C-terminal domain-containing protein [Nannocystaceae bacterium]
MPTLPSNPTPAASTAEVVVRLGDTRLDVRHLGAPRTRGRAAIASLAALMALAAASFAVGVALQGIAAATAAALACGLAVAAIASAARVGGPDRRGDRFQIGEGHGADLPLAITGVDARGIASLVTVDREGVTLHLVGGLEGELHEGGEVVDFAALRERSPGPRRLPAGAHAVLRRGPLTIEVRALARDQAPLPALDRPAFDRGLWLGQAASVAVLGTLFLALAHLKPALVDLDGDFEVERSRILVALAESTPRPSPAAEAPTPAAEAPTPMRPTLEPPSPQPSERGPRLVDPAAGEDADSSAIPAIATVGPHDPGARAEEAPVSAQEAALGEVAREWIAEVESRSIERYRDTEEDRDAWVAHTSGSSDRTRETGGLALKAVVVDATASGTVGITDREIAETFMAQRAKARRRPRDDGFHERPTLASARSEARSVASTSPFAFGVRGAPSVIGSLDQAHASAVVQHHRPHLAQCWGDARRRDPDLKARLTVAVTVNPRGKVKRVEFPGTLGDPELGRCLAMSIREWRYDAPPDGEPSVVTYTLSFGGA